MATTYNHLNVAAGPVSPGGLYDGNASPYNPNIQEHQITGQLLSVDVRYDYSLIEAKQIDEAKIKLELIQKIVEEMFKKDYISFTKQLNSIDYKMHYRAYVFVTPNGNTQVIRQHLKDTK